MADRLGNTERAYEQLRQAIVEGRYAPGQRLVEQAIGEELRLSRTPVREALRRLEAEGLVVTERNCGASVRPIGVDDIADLYDLRSHLEAMMAERAAERATPAEHAALAAAADAFDAAVPATDHADLAALRRLHDANGRFHGTLASACHHAHLQRTLARAVDVPLVFQAFRQFDRAATARSALFHHLIADAVREGAADRAGRLMTEHILQGRDALIAAIDDQASVDDLFGRPTRLTRTRSA
jgi:DNA-binding GntR family transcriptional regulator